MERLQGGRATGTPVAAQLHTTFLQCPRLHIERKVLWVLDTLNVLPLFLPYLLDPFVVQQRNSQSVLSVRTVKQIDQWSNRSGGLLQPPGPPPAVQCQLPPGNASTDRPFRDVAGLLCRQLSLLCTAKNSHILWIPLKDARGQTCHEDPVERMSLCRDTCSKSPHEVPDVETHFKLIPLREHDLHPRLAVLTAAISVHVHHFWGCLSCLPVAFHQASCHVVQSMSLGGCQHRDEDLAVFVSHICAPGSCSCSSTGKFLCDLLGKIKGCVHYVRTHIHNRQISGYKRCCDTFFVESILRTQPRTDVILALTSCSRPRTSLAYTDNSHLGLGRAGKRGGSANTGGCTREDLVNGSQAVRYCRTRCVHASLCCSISFL